MIKERITPYYIGEKCVDEATRKKIDEWQPPTPEEMDALIGETVKASKVGKPVELTDRQTFVLAFLFHQMGLYSFTHPKTGEKQQWQ